MSRRYGRRVPANFSCASVSEKAVPVEKQDCTRVFSGNLSVAVRKPQRVRSSHTSAKALPFFQPASACTRLKRKRPHLFAAVMCFTVLVTPWYSVTLPVAGETSSGADIAKPQYPNRSVSTALLSPGFSTAVQMAGITSVPGLRKHSSVLALRLPQAGRPGAPHTPPHILAHYRDHCPWTRRSPTQFVRS